MSESEFEQAEHQSKALLVLVNFDYMSDNIYANPIFIMFVLELSDVEQYFLSHFGGKEGGFSAKDGCLKLNRIFNMKTNNLAQSF